MRMTASRRSLPIAPICQTPIVRVRQQKGKRTPVRMEVRRKRNDALKQQLAVMKMKMLRNRRIRTRRVQVKQIRKKTMTVKTRRNVKKYSRSQSEQYPRFVQLPLE
ncbi:hypothetical protein OSTOST_20597 [Ostertagia ostertagi]